MNSPGVDSILTEIAGGDNFGYVLNKSNTFSATEYKVLHSQRQHFVPCIKMLYNGSLELYYLTDSLRSVASVANMVTKSDFIIIVRKLLSSIISVKHNGFLNCANIVPDLSKVFVDYREKNVRLIYVPLTIGLLESGAGFENELRTNLLKYILDMPRALNSSLSELKGFLVDRTLSLEEIVRKIDETYSSILMDDKSKVCKIVGVNAPVPIELTVDKEVYLIGRKPDVVDGLLNFSKSISRVHCEISRRDGLYYISDMDSKGGTSVNGHALLPHTPCAIYDGDEIELSHYQFKVVLE